MVTENNIKKFNFYPLLQLQVIKFIEKNLNEKSVDLAVKQRKNERFPPIVYTQLKNLQKSKTKLPTFFKHRAIIPTRAFEQCSSEQTAGLKDISGDSFLDLTCGLGVDSLYLSKKFDQGIALEANEELATISQHNFKRLSLNTVQVHHQSAENFLSHYQGKPFDLIYADPDRRDAQGQRQIVPQKLQPDIISLLPQLRKHTQRLLLKMSPLYDIQAAYQDFGSEMHRIVVVSVNNECKEMWIDMTLGKEQAAPNIEIKCVRKERLETYHFEWSMHASQVHPTNWESFSHQFPQTRYILEPDVAFYKARTTHALFEQLKLYTTGRMNHSMGYFFSENKPPRSFPGRVFEIVDCFPFQPKKLKRSFNKRKLHVAKRFAPFSVKEIRKRIGVLEGGTDFLLCTQWGKQTYVFLAKPLSIYL